MRLSDEPELRGDIYCAPSCGRNCTKAEFDTATENAKKLAEELGEGWVPRVQENLGWHYSAVSPCGRLKVHPPYLNQYRKGDAYCAFLGEAGFPGGAWTERGKTPAEAVAKVVATGKRQVAWYLSLVEGL